jgi:hypothetical protein
LQFDVEDTLDRTGLHSEYSDRIVQTFTTSAGAFATHWNTFGEESSSGAGPLAGTSAHVSTGSTLPSTQQGFLDHHWDLGQPSNIQNHPGMDKESMDQGYTASGTHGNSGNSGDPVGPGTQDLPHFSHPSKY